MGFIGSLLSGSKGAGFQGQGTNILQPTTTAQAQTAYGQQQQALQQQQNFVNALAAQGQLGMGSQSQLTQQLQQQAQGQGPNPAQAALQNATGQNIANQAALMAGQRGASSNAGLIAREAAQQGAATQQQAVGQSAVLQAQQQLAAQQQLQQLASSQLGQQQGALGQLNQNVLQGQQNILGGINNQNQANVAMQSNINNANAGIAQQNAQGQQQIAGGLLGGLGALAPVIGAAHGGEIQSIPTYGYADGGQVPPTQESEAQGIDLRAFKAIPTSTPTPTPDKTEAGARGALKGAYVGAYDDGGEVGAGAAQGVQAADASSKGPSSFVGQFLKGFSDSYNAGNKQQASGLQSGMSSLISQAPKLAMLAASKGGKVPAMVSPGEKYLPPAKAKAVAEGKASTKDAERIPGKAEVPGDSLKNDTVKKTLEEGGVVIPRSKVGDKNKEADFVAAVLAKSAMKKGKKHA